MRWEDIPEDDWKKDYRESAKKKLEKRRRG
jgi:hypothetical protein